jgi:RNA polymerase sigma factor for flagellar operon FliA
VNGYADAREELIRDFLPLVKKIARRIKRLVPGYDLDDLIGDGSIGLIRAVDSYDPLRGPALEHYARRLIAGAMLNGIRRMDPVSERARRALRDGERQRYTIALTRGSLPELAEIESLCPGFERARAAVHRGAPLSLDAPLPERERLSDDWSGDPARVSERTQADDALRAVVDALPARQREVVMQHYYAGRSLRAIGRCLCISPQRASQLHLMAIQSLRKSAHAATY